jgi:hypothetical protein
MFKLHYKNINCKEAFALHHTEKEGGVREKSPDFAGTLK